MTTLSTQDLERVYDTLAGTIDAIDEDKQMLFLTKLALLFAHDIGDVAVIEKAIKAAAVFEGETL